MPEGAVRKIEAWLQGADAHAGPSHALLIEAAIEAEVRGVIGIPECHSEEDGAFIRCPLNKPKREGLPYRDLDPEALALLLLLVLAGGRISLEAKGPGHDYYYVRLYIDGARADGQLRRVHFLRVVANTARGLHTEEPADFRSLRRRDLGIYRANKSTEPLGLYGADQAKQDAIERFRELVKDAPEGKLAGLDEAHYVALLELAHRLLMAVPLGKATDDEAA